MHSHEVQVIALRDAIAWTRRTIQMQSIIVSSLRVLGTPADTEQTYLTQLEASLASHKRSFDILKRQNSAH